MGIKTITYDSPSAKRCRDYRQKLRFIQSGDAQLREGLVELSRDALAVVDTVIAEWHGAWFLCDVRGLCIRSRDPSCLFFWTDLQEMPTARLYRLDDASAERLGEFARLVLLADRRRNGGVVSYVRGVRSARRVGGGVK